MQVRFTEPGRMNLVGYFFRDLLRARLGHPKSQEAAQKLGGTFVFNASGMQITLLFTKEGVEIVQGKPDHSDCEIAGDLNTLLDIALGQNYLKFLVARKIKIQGNIKLLRKLVRFMRGDLSP